MDENLNQVSVAPESAPQETAPQPAAANVPMKFCKHCGMKIAEDAVMCIHCGRQVEELKSASAAQPQIVINNDNINTNANANLNGLLGARMKNKWVALVLCLLLGWLGGHKFYEGKVGMGILYLFTLGLFGIGVLIDFIVLLFKPNPYFV